MADRSGDGKDAVGEDGDGQSLASRLPSSGTQTPAEPAEPEPEAAAAEASELSVAATEGGAAAAEQAEPGEGPVAVEAAAAAGPEEPAEAEAEPAGPAEAGTEAQPAGEPPKTPPEEPPKTGSEARSEGLEDEGEGEEEEREPEEHEEGAEQEEEGEQEERKTEAPTQAVPRVSEVSEEEAAPAREAEKEKREEEAAEEEALAKAVERDAAGSHKKSEDEGKGMVLGIEDEDEDEESKDQSWSEEVQKEHEQQLRTELLEQYRALLSERNHYQRYNIYLQHKIYEALRKKKGLDAAEVPDKGSEPEAPEKEQAYLRSLALLEELRKQEADDLAWYHQELNKLKQQCQQKLARVEREWGAFQALKKQVVMQAMGSCRLRGGRQAALREVEQIQALEDKKEKEMSAVRLENVQLKQSLVHFETRMRAQADLTDGLLLIDFEQLKIENQTFNEKVEERNEELLKLRSKVTSNVQVITHVKEKLHFMEIENARKKSHLLDIEAQVALKRDILTKTKQARDSLRIDNVKLNQRCGLLGKESLLRDLEEKVDKTEVLRQRLESLKRHHAGLALSCRGVRQKIREAKAFLPS